MAKKQTEPAKQVALVHRTNGTRVRVSEAMVSRMTAYRPESQGPSGDPDESWTLAQLGEYAASHGIDLGGATRKADVLDAILESQLDEE